MARHNAGRMVALISTCAMAAGALFGCGAGGPPEDQLEFDNDCPAGVTARIYDGTAQWAELFAILWVPPKSIRSMAIDIERDFRVDYRSPSGRTVTEVYSGVRPIKIVPRLACT